MGREEQLLAIKIANTLEKAKAAEEAYVRIIETSNADALNDPENDELHDQEEILEHYIKEAFRECRMLAERMHMPSEASDIRNILKSYGDNLLGTRLIPGDITQYCPSLAEISQIYQSMAEMVLGGAVTGLNVLETILRNTAKIIGRSKLLPDHETDIRNEVLEILKLAFVDARREGQIVKSFKVYKPDIVVPSLMAAIEYKQSAIEALAESRSRSARQTSAGTED